MNDYQQAVRSLKMAQEMIAAAAKLVYLPIEFCRASDVVRALVDKLEEL